MNEAGDLISRLKKRVDISARIHKYTYESHAGQDFPGYDAELDMRTMAEIERFKAELDAAKAERDNWARYASYCRCCAESGEHGVHDFDAFMARSTHGEKGGAEC